MDMPNEQLAGSQPTFPAFASTIAQAPAHRRREAIEQIIQQMFAALCDLPSAHDVPTDRGFWELGLTSVRAVALQRTLEGAAGRRLPPSMLFDYASVRSLSAYILALYQTPSPQPAKVDPADHLPTGQISGDLAALEQELDLLADMLGQPERSESRTGRAPGQPTRQEP